MISSMEHTSFNLLLTTSCSTPQTPPRPVWRCLSFSSADNYTQDSTPVCSDSSDDDEEEDFQTVPLGDEHWTSEETPERNLCIHGHGLPAWIMPVPMSLHKLWHYFLHGKFGFKWHFWLRGLHGYLQWWRDTREWKKYHTNIELWFAWTFVLT